VPHIESSNLSFDAFTGSMSALMIHCCAISPVLTLPLLSVTIETIGEPSRMLGPSYIIKPLIVMVVPRYIVLDYSTALVIRLSGNHYNPMVMDKAVCNVSPMIKAKAAPVTTIKAMISNTLVGCCLR